MIAVPVLTVERPSWGLINKADAYPTLTWVDTVQGIKTLFVLPPSFHGEARPDVGEHRHAYQVPDIFGGVTPRAQFIANEGATTDLFDTGLITTCIVSGADGSPLPIYKQMARVGTRIDDHPYTNFLSNSVSLLYVHSDPATHEVRYVTLSTVQANLQGDLYIIERQHITPHQTAQMQPQIDAAQALVRCKQTDCAGHYHS